jgi:hypothetical protein
MNGKLLEYVIYLPASVILVVWVATTLFRHGRRFLVDVFHNDDELADSVNHLLVVGFYLINLGYVALQLNLSTAPTSAAGVVEALASKVGLVLVVLGVVHFANLFVFSQLRSNSRRPVAPVQAGPQPLPDARPSQ